jgi:predicted dehydrogenase
MKVGVIGYGGAFNAGKQHMERMAAQENFEPAAICDIDPKREEAAKADFPGITYYTDIDEMLARSEVELVSVVLPHNLHAPIALKCLRAGKHVVVEKPLAITVEECDQLIEESRRQGKILVPYHNRHWDAIPLTMVANLDKIGRTVRWESHWAGWNKPRDWWRANKDVAGGIMYDWGAHIMEWMLQVMPYEMTEISGFAVDEVWPAKIEDEITVTVRFGKNGVGYHVASDIDDIERGPLVRVIGTKGSLTGRMVDWDNSEVVLHQEDANGIRQRTILPILPENQAAFYRNVHDHLMQGDDLVITAELGRRVIQILDYGSQSAVSGGAMKAKYG